MSEFKIHGLSAEGKAYRAALEAIQELHSSWVSDDGAKEELFCTHCRQADYYEWDYVPYPCPTRRLADEALNTN